jgi:hypothetical protein
MTAFAAMTALPEMINCWAQGRHKAEVEGFPLLVCPFAKGVMDREVAVLWNMEHLDEYLGVYFHLSFSSNLAMISLLLWQDVVHAKKLLVDFVRGNASR